MASTPPIVDWNRLLQAMEQQRQQERNRAYRLQVLAQRAVHDDDDDDDKDADLLTFAPPRIYRSRRSQIVQSVGRNESVGGVHINGIDVSQWLDNASRLLEDDDISQEVDDVLSRMAQQSPENEDEFMDDVVQFLRGQLQQQASVPSPDEVAARFDALGLGKDDGDSAATAMLKTLQKYKDDDAVMDDDDDNEAATCTICLSSKACIALVPCGHTRMCATCTTMVVERAAAANVTPLCPQCRATFTQCVRVFL